MSLKFGPDWMATCQLQLATLAVDGRLNHRLMHAKFSGHHFELVDLLYLRGLLHLKFKEHLVKTKKKMESK